MQKLQRRALLCFVVTAVSGFFAIALAGSHVSTQSVKSVESDASKPVERPASTLPPYDVAAYIAETRRTMRLLAATPARLEATAGASLSEVAGGLFAGLPVALQVDPHLSEEALSGAIACTFAGASVEDATIMLCRYASVGWTVRGQVVQLYDRTRGDFAGRDVRSYDVHDIYRVMLSRELAVRTEVRASANKAPDATAPESEAKPSRSGSAANCNLQDMDGEDLADNVASRLRAVVYAATKPDLLGNMTLGPDGLLVVRTGLLEHVEIEDFLTELRKTLKLETPK